MRALAALFALTCARSAHADPVDDFSNGSLLMLDSGAVTLDGNHYSTGGLTLPKPAFTLNLGLAASAFGLNLPITIQLTGVKVTGNVVSFGINQTFSPGVALGGATLTSLQGSILIQVSKIPGLRAGQPGNVYLSPLGINVLFAQGDFGTKQIWLDQLRAVGGVPQPSMASLINPAPNEPVCSDTTPTSVPLSVWIASPAPTGGAKVDLASAAPAGVHVPFEVTIPAGIDNVTFTATIAPSYVGKVELSAAANGFISTTFLDVQPTSACTTPPSKPRYLLEVPPWLLDCGCTTFTTVNEPGEQLITVSRQSTLISNGVATNLLTAFSGSHATAVTATALNNLGQIAGRMTVHEISQGFRASMDHGVSRPTLLGNIVPTAMSSFGTIVGYRPTSTGSTVAIYVIGSTVTDLPLTSSLGVSASRATGVNDDGSVIGTYADNAGLTHGFVWRNGTTTTIPVLGSTPATPVALNANHQIAVTSTAGDLPVAGIFSTVTGAISRLGVPSGYSYFRIKSLNRWGWAAGVATTSDGVNRGFAWAPGRGFIPLTNYVRGLTALDAMQITDANEVVIQGTTTSDATINPYLVTL
jgi:probable HAF family extracellular repeat protein